MRTGQKYGNFEIDIRVVGRRSLFDSGGLLLCALDSGPLSAKEQEWIRSSDRGDIKHLVFSQQADVKGQGPMSNLSLEDLLQGLSDIISGLLSGKVESVLPLLEFLNNFLNGVLGTSSAPVLDCVSTFLVTFSEQISVQVEVLQSCTDEERIEIVAELNATVYASIDDCGTCVQAVGCSDSLLEVITDSLSSLVDFIFSSI